MSAFLNCDFMTLTEIENLAQENLKKFGLADAGWTFAFDNAKTRLGACHYARKRISVTLLAAKFAEAAEIIDTLLHEIAHALVGEDHGHDEIWKAKAAQIGCTANRCGDFKIPPNEATYVGTCPACQAIRTRFTRPKKRAACTDCCRKFNQGTFCVDYEFIWIDNRTGKCLFPNENGYIHAPGHQLYFLAGSPHISPKTVQWCLDQFTPIESGVIVFYNFFDLKTVQIWAKVKNLEWISYSLSNQSLHYLSNLTNYSENFFLKTSNEILGLANTFLAIWDGKEDHTKNLILRSLKAEKPTIVFNLEKRRVTKFNT